MPKKSWYPEDRAQAEHVIWQTMIILRKQLNKALGCKLKDGEFEFLTKSVMKSLYGSSKTKRS
jgi:hypothetical protein